MKSTCWMAGALLSVVLVLGVTAAPIRVSLDYFANPNHIPLYVAMDQGFFDEEGVEVDIFVPASPSDPVKLAAAQAVEIALTPQINYLIARSEDLPLIAIGALIGRPLGGLLALRDQGIGTLEDLAGKRIGYALAPLEPILWQTVFACAGVDPTGLDLVNVGFNTMTALLTGNVEAIGAFRNYEVLQLEELGYEPVFFPQENYCVPMTYEILLVAHPDFVSQRTAEATGFIGALAKAIDWTIAYPDEALALFFNRFPELEDNLNIRSFETTLPLYAVGARHADEAIWDAMQSYLLTNGLMSQSFPTDALYTDSLLPSESKE
ncbi:ABC transporter substrate-binding protein [Candidatus Bipolaricaulota bacterium]|nr:ABC transporter substrate-binding protein [Candidatus Bipolaricaulota bacterium]